MRFFILFFCTLFLGSNLMAQTVTDKLEAYFSFNNCTGVDDSGNGSVAALKGGIGCDCGINGMGMRFKDSTQNALNLVGPFADVFTTSDFTVSFYIRPPDGQNVNSQLIMAKQDSCNLKNAFWVRYVPKNKRISAGISENDTLLATVSAKLMDEGSCWQFITITRSNNLFSLYVNGTLRDSKTSAARIDLTNTTPLKIGEPVCQLDKYYVGLFDELRFHSKALSEQEIAKYNLKSDQILNRDTLVYLGNSFQITTSTFCAKDFTWSPTTGVSDPTSPNPIITPVDSTLYTVQIEYADHCLATDHIFVRVIDPKTLDCNLVFVPNAFTPGGSPNLNDQFGISNPFAVDEFISFEIFDRWGGRMFNATTAFDVWDGTANGEPLNPGVFLYRLRYKCNGVEKVKAGSVTLLR